MDKATKQMIEEGRAMVCGDYTIENATDIYGNDNGLGVYVFDKNGDTVKELHLNEETYMLEPVSFEEAISWCENNGKEVKMLTAGITIMSEDNQLAHGALMPGWATIEDVKDYLDTSDAYDDGIEEQDIEDWTVAWVTLPGNECWNLYNLSDGIKIEKSDYHEFADTFTREGYESMTEEEVAHELKLLKARALSGWASYPETMNRIAETTAECFGDEWAEMAEDMSAEQIGNYYKLAKYAYDKGHNA